MTETELRAAITAEQAAYHAAAETAPAPELRERSARIKTLRDQLNELMRRGASPCPKCSGLPHAMLKRPAIGSDDLGFRPVYECGCLACGTRSRHWTLDGAVAKWNAGKYIPDARMTAKPEIQTIA
jgi:hypothetical protein